MLGVIGAVVGATVTFVAATATAAVVHLDVPATRRLVATQVTSVLRGQLAGDVAIERIGGLGLRGVDGVRVRVKDPTGMQVLFVDGAKVRLRALDAARSALFGKGDIVVPVDAVSIDHVDAAIDGDGTPAGNLRIANAFAPKKPSPPKPADPNARGLRVEAPELVLRHAWVHGQPSAGLPVDADVTDLLAKAHVDPKVITADVDHVDFVTRNMQPKVDPRGRVVAHVRLPQGDDAAAKDASGKAGAPKMTVSATFDGHVAGSPTNAEAKLDGDRVDARLDLRGVTADKARAAFGEIPIHDEVSAHAEVHGTTQVMKATANVGIGAGTVDVDADVDLTDGTRVDTRVAARHIDARAAVASAPQTDVNLDTRAKVTLAKDGHIGGDFALDMLPSRLEGEDLPRVSLKGDFTKDTANVDGRIHDPRVPTRIQVAMSTVGGARVVQADVTAKVPELAKLPKMKNTASGSADVHAKAHVDLSTKVVDARVEARAANVAVSGGAQRVRDVRALVTAQGTMDKPFVDVGVHAGGIDASGQRLGAADVRGKVEVGAVTVVRDAMVDLVKDGRTVTAFAKRVEVGGPRIVVEGATVNGLGQPIHADFSRDPRAMHVRVDAPSIDLARAAALAGRNDVAQGTLSLASDMTLRRDGAQGELHAKVGSLTGLGIRDASMTLDSKLEGKNVDVDLEAKLSDAGELSLHTKELVLGGSPVDPASWQKAKGRAKLAAIVDLKRVAAMAPEGSLPLGELAGQLTVAGTIRRDSVDVPPEVSLHAHTRGLVASGKAAEPEPPLDGTRVAGVAPWRTQGLDVAFDAKVDATSGFGEVAFRAWDARGTVAAFDGKADLPYQELLANPNAAMAKLANVPMQAKLLVPKRELAHFPAIAKTQGYAGAFEAELDIGGTPVEPKIQLVAKGRGLRAPSLPTKMATDADVNATYDGNAADLAVNVKSGGRDALALSAHADVRARDLVAGAPGKPLPWKGSAKAKLASFPLDTIDALADMRVKGRISGEATIDDLHQDGKLRAELGLEDLRIGRATYRGGRIVVDARNGKLQADARLEQTDGFADVHATAGMKWGDAVAPSLDPNGAVDARLQAKAFRAAAALPFVQGSVNQLDGRVDADARLHIGPGGQAPQMDGRIVLREGRIQLADVGDELQDARATVTVHDGVIKIDDVYARSIDGQIHASAVVKTRGLALDTATADVRIPEDHRLDLAMQGAPIGEVWGNAKVNAKASPDGKKLDVKVDVPRFEVRMSETMKSGLQELSENEKIRIGTYRDAHTFVKLPMDKEDVLGKKPKAGNGEEGVTTTVDVKLGDITVVYGRMARISLTGAPHVELEPGADPKVTGQVQVKQGKVDVQGKKFEIEKCTVTFQEEDASNPIVMATAGWTADDGTKIYADFVGPVKTGKVTLRSEPSRPRNEILAIILFGTADGANAQPPPPGRAPDGTTKAAVGVGGGYAAQGLSEAMDDLTGIEATARIDSSRANNPAPEIEIQIARRVSLAVQHVLGTPPLSEPDKNLATVDWRFRKNWSLETTIGDRGKAQVDAVWQKRY